MERSVMEYLEYLTTDHWKQVALEAKQRANWQCALCASSSSLHVHHRTYARVGREQPADLVVLCWSCHAKFHGEFMECAERQLLLPRIPWGPELN
jgi:5-methylcytosine-specific restriction endonuclease McrA